ncbi:cupin domain-containing protein [Methanospirillum purgamenti]|jgi:quercetin dioxygenase-like cupin family protein|uniref:Cupin domain-containing protein n=1 Tax=Methanospirillum hungatei TaxID=2203 RepID=A0A8F5VLY1_METHU|nr:cupin domain-containing protein [Methanospirillum hungatei]QXO94461.1 cupin domain-containing protein [Methanospirillum hungatei]
MNFRYPVIATAFILSLLTCSVLFADNSWEKSEGIVLTEDNYEWVHHDELLNVTDVFSRLDLMSGMTLSPNTSLTLYNADPGAVLSPDAILPVPEVIYVLEGTINITADDEQILAGPNDAVYIPPMKLRRYENADEGRLRFFSLLDWTNQDSNATSIDEDGEEGYHDTTVRIRTEETISPHIIGNQTSNETFRFYRLLHPEEDALELSYDLGSVWMSEGSQMPDHYIDDRYQLITILSGSGNYSVGCTQYPVNPGDIVFAAPGAVMNSTADQDLHLLVITNPYYEEKYDHAIPGACDVII